MLNHPSQLDRLIRFHRRAAGLSQIELAGQAGVSRTVVQRLERGDVMASWQNVLKILAVVRVEVGFASPLLGEFERVGVQAIETHFHALIRERAGEFLAQQPVELPELSRALNPGLRRWLSIPGLSGGFQYWFADQDPEGEPRLIVESWDREVACSEARHEITSEGCKFVGRIINGVDFSAKAPGSAPTSTDR